jgi:teichuronic acid exporter
MFKNIIWDFVGKFSVQLISFAISVILTRLLSPGEFGVMGMALAVVIIAHIFLDLGFNKAIIQFKEISPLQYSSIFYLNVAVAVCLTIVCYFMANPLASFYHQRLIAPVFKVLSFSFLLNGLNLVPSALLYKKLQFKLNSMLTIISSVAGGIVGIVMAYNGYGVWSLVAQSMLTSTILLVTNFVFAGWFPQLAFSLKSIKPLWAYGSRMFASGLLDNVYTKLDVFIIGRIFNVSTLGFYTRAQSMDNFVRQLSVNSIVGALFPYISKHQDDRNFLNDLYTKYLHIICFVSIALSGTLMLISKYFFLLLFGPRWLYSAQLFQLLAVVGFAWPVSSLMCNIISGVGNSKAFLRLEFFKKILFLPVYFFGFIWGLEGFLYVFILANIISVILNAAFVSNEISITIIKQIKIIFSYFGIAAAGVIMAHLFDSLFVFPSLLLSIIALTITFNLVYFAAAYLFQLAAPKNTILLIKKLQIYFYDKRNKNFFAAI